MDERDPLGTDGVDDADRPAADAVGSTRVLPPHPVLMALAAVDAGVDALAAANLWSMSEHELLAARIGVEGTRGRLDAAVLAMTHEIDGRGAAVRVGASSTAAWLRAVCRQRPAVAHGEVRLASELDQELPALAAALATGQIAHESARVVADTLRKLPASVDAATKARGEAFLVEQARHYDAAAVAALGRHLLERLDPTHGRELEREEALREEAEAFTVVHGLDGSRPVRGQLTPEHGATLDAALEVLAAPQRGPDGEPDRRSAEKRRADALMLLISWGLASEQMPSCGGENVTLTVVTTPGHLQNAGVDTDAYRSATPPWHTAPDQTSPAGDAANEGAAADGVAADGAADVGDEADVDIDGASDGPAADKVDDHAHADDLVVAGLLPGEDAAFLPDGSPLSPESTRRLGCDAWLVAAIIDSAGALLDIGRRSRIVPAAMRRALIVRDGGCAFPGCGRPPSWCHAHHIRHWSKGGPTALHNLVLLCAHHHQVIHHDGWTAHLDRRGLPVFTPSRWVDPDQTPRPAWRPITILRT